MSLSVTLRNLKLQDTTHQEWVAKKNETSSLIFQKLTHLNLSPAEAQSISSFASTIFHSDEPLPHRPIKFQEAGKAFKATVFKSDEALEIYFHPLKRVKEKQVVKEKSEKSAQKCFYRSLHLTLKDNQISADISGLLKYNFVKPQSSENFEHELKMLESIKKVPHMSQLQNHLTYLGKSGKNACKKGLIYIDYAKRGDLQQFIDRTKDLSSQDRHKIFRSLLQALLSLNHQIIIHNDLKPSNILLNSFSDCVVADFEYSLSKEDCLNEEKFTNFLKRKGTPFFLPPERVNFILGISKKSRGLPEKPGIPTNAWGIGCTLYFLCYHQFPKICYSIANYSSITDEIIKAGKNLNKDAFREKLTAAQNEIKNNLNEMKHNLKKGNFSILEEIINKFLHPNPNKRLTAEKALELFEKVTVEDFKTQVAPSYM